MTDWTITLRATVPDEDTAALFRAEILKASALLGVQICQLEAFQERGLRLVRPEPPDPGAA